VCVPDVFFANFWPRYATKRPRYLSQHVFSAVIGAAALCSNVQRQGKPGVSSFCPCMVCPYRMRGYSILQCEVYNAPSRSEVYLGSLGYIMVHISSSRMPLIVESFSPGGANISLLLFVPKAHRGRCCGTLILARVLERFSPVKSLYSRFKSPVPESFGYCWRTPLLVLYNLK